MMSRIRSWLLSTSSSLFLANKQSKSHYSGLCTKSYLLSFCRRIKSRFWLNSSNIFRCTAFSYLEGDPELAFFAVYDGHGGTGVANYLKDHLHEFILDQPEYKEGNMEESVLKAFLQVSTTYYSQYDYFFVVIWLNLSR